MSEQRKQQVYDDFRAHVIHNCRKYNKQLDVVPYLDEKLVATSSHLKIPLTNLTKATKQVFERIESYGEGTSLVARENYQTGEPMYIANVPYRDAGPKHKKHKHRHSSKDVSDSIVTPLLWGMGLLGTITIAALTTTKEQWLALIN